VGSLKSEHVTPEEQGLQVQEVKTPRKYRAFKGNAIGGEFLLRISPGSGR
jgi:hypothetical protein